MDMKLIRCSLVGALFLGACVDPVMVDPPDDCTVLSQNQYVIDVMKHAYLWNHEVPDLDPSLYDEPAALLADLRYREVDRWSRVSDKAQSDALFEAGKFIGYGFNHMRDDDDKIRVSFVHDDSPASRAGLRRGDEIVEINRLSIAEIDAGGLWGDMFGPTELGIRVDLQVVEDEGAVREVSLEKDWIKIVTVPVSTIIESDGRKIGYLVFSTFVDTAIPELDEVVAGFRQAGVQELIVDLRYNGGGRLSVARHLASLIAGDAGHDRDVAYSVNFNDDLAAENESVKLERLAHALTVDRVYFITTRRTLSASELVINAVRPYVDTYVIGATTGGKPVGMRSFDFCDKILFPITFRLVNADGETDYYDGFAPDCVADDDLLRQLGEPSEGSLAATLGLIRDGTCVGGDPNAGAPAPSPDERLFRDDPLRATIGSW
ncbi:MAG: PDZ domain-containing protein [Myxococcales bacterium]|nr:PDZ domain-containing protein [Myxococcales bacterium]MCB9700421.1 PDZ domain-containing protein [Myxococcales bacterium]